MTFKLLYLMFSSSLWSRLIGLFPCHIRQIQKNHHYKVYIYDERLASFIVKYSLRLFFSFCIMPSKFQFKLPPKIPTRLSVLLLRYLEWQSKALRLAMLLPVLTNLDLSSLQFHKSVAWPKTFLLSWFLAICWHFSDVKLPLGAMLFIGFTQFLIWNCQIDDSYFAWIVDH